MFKVQLTAASIALLVAVSGCGEVEIGGDIENANDIEGAGFEASMNLGPNPDALLDGNRDGKMDKGTWMNKYENQWYLAKTKVPSAWTYMEQSLAKAKYPEINLLGEGITIALPDTGVDFSHEDLGPNVTFDAGDPVPASQGDPAAIEAYNNDRVGHGTAVAGILAATQGNGVGMSGVAPRSTVIAYNVLNATQDDLDPLRISNDVAPRILGNPDVDIVLIANSEWNTYDFFRTNVFGTGLCQMISDAADLGKIVIVAAGQGTGNANGLPGNEQMGVNVDYVDAIQTGSMPANCEDAITVTGYALGPKSKARKAVTEKPFQKSAFANFGLSIDIAAPAGDGYRNDPGDDPATGTIDLSKFIPFGNNNILTLRAAGTTPVKDAIMGTRFPLEALTNELNAVVGYRDDHRPSATPTLKKDITEGVSVRSSLDDPSAPAKYMRWRGTGLAAAQVAGTVALMLSGGKNLRELQGRARVNAVRSILLSTTSKKTMPDVGAGELNTLAAVKAAMAFE